MDQKEIISKILEASKHVNQITRNGSADYIITSSEYSDLMDEAVNNLKSIEIHNKISNLLDKKD